VPDVLVPGQAVDHFAEEPPEWIEPMLSGDDLIAQIHASKEETGMHIWWLGQSGVLVQVAGENILLDPYLSDTVTELFADTDTPYDRITGIAVDPSSLSFVDIVTSSHAHLDHLDPGTLPHVLSGGAAFICAAGSEQIAEELAGKKPDAALAVDDDVEFGGFSVRAVPAYHADAPEAVGYIVRNGAYVFYHSGDTRRVEGIAEAIAPHAVDVAFLPINGGDNMNGADAARLAYEGGVIMAVPCHYEMFRQNTASTSRFVAECARIGQEYRRLRVGERLTIDYGF